MKGQQYLEEYLFMYARFWGKHCFVDLNREHELSSHGFKVKGSILSVVFSKLLFLYWPILSVLGHFVVKVVS